MADNNVKNRYAALMEGTKISSALNEDKHKDEYTSKIRSYYDNLQKQKRNDQLKAQGKSDADIKIIDTLGNIRKEKAQKNAAYEASKPVSGFTTDKAVEVGKVLSGNAPATSKIFDTTGLKTLEERRAEQQKADTETFDTLKYLFGTNTPAGERLIENVVKTADKVVPEPVQYAARRGTLGTVSSLASIADTVEAVRKGIENAQNGGSFKSGFANYLKGGDNLQAYTEQQKEKVEANLRDKPNVVTNALGDLSESFGYMIPSLAASAVSGAAGIPAAISKVVSATPLAASGFASGTREALKNGATENEALAYGALSALIESAGEYAIGGVLGKGSGLIDTGLKKLGLDISKNIANPVVKSLVNYGTSALGEGTEEVIQEALSVGARKLTYDEAAKIDAGELAYAGLLGALMGGVGSLPSGISNTVSGARTVSEYKKFARDISDVANNGGINDAKTIADGMRTAWAGQINAIESNKTYDPEQKEIAAAPYKWLVQETDKLINTLSSTDYKEAVYSNPATAEDVKSGEITKAEAIEKNKNIIDAVRNDNSLATDEKKSYIDPITKEAANINAVEDVRPDSGEFDDMAGIREAMEEIATEERAEAQAKSEEDKLIEQIAKETNAEIEAARNPEEVPMPPKQSLTESAESGTIETVETPVQEQPADEAAKPVETPEAVKEVALPEAETVAEVPETEQNVSETSEAAEVSQEETEEAPTESRFKNDTLDVVTKKHTKTGADLIVGKVNRTLPKEEYAEFNKAVKAAGGYYSKYAGGFVFPNEESLDKMRGVIGINDTRTVSDTGASVQETAVEPEVDEAVEAVREAVKARTAEAEATEAVEPTAEAPQEAQTAPETAEETAAAESEAEEETAAEQPQEVAESEKETVEESTEKSEQEESKPKNPNKPSNISKNAQKIANGIESGMSADELNLRKGKVSGFDLEQREYIADALVDGLKTDVNEIHVEVPRDGTLDINNNPESVAHVLDRLGASAPEIELTTVQKNAMRYMASKDRLIYAPVGDKTVITDGMVGVVLPKAAADAFVEEHIKISEANNKATEIYNNVSKAEKVALDRTAQYVNVETWGLCVEISDANGEKYALTESRLNILNTSKSAELNISAMNSALSVVTATDGSEIVAFTVARPESVIRREIVRTATGSGKAQKVGLPYKKGYFDGTSVSTEPTETIKENNENGENADNQGTVQQPVTDRQGDTRVLDEVETGDVQGTERGRKSVGGSEKRGRKAERDDTRTDAERTGRGSGEGDSESGNIRTDGLKTESKPLKEEVSELKEQKSTEKPKGSNFVIGDSLDLPSGEKSRYKANVEAIRLVKQLMAEDRYATPEEQTVLSKYVGWGGLANAFDESKSEWSKEYAELKEILSEEEYKLAKESTLNAHYTDISVIKAMYDGLKQLGFNGGRMLEPASGVGNFVGAMPADMSDKVKSWTMIELDSITGQIAKYLYPNANVKIQGFEKALIPDSYMDVAISNVPFGNYAINDKKYPASVTGAIHNYFFAKALDKVRPGGIVMFITSSYTMNSRDSSVRRYIAERADLIGAIRLPDTAFKVNAGTEVVTDIIVLKKREAGTPYAGENFLDATWQQPGAYINQYFADHPEMALGTPSMDGGMYRGNSLTYKPLDGKGTLADQIREAFSNINAKMDYPEKPTPEQAQTEAKEAIDRNKQNGFAEKDGKLYRISDGALTEYEGDAKSAERIKGMLNLRSAARELLNSQLENRGGKEIEKARKNLNDIYDKFVKANGFINAQANKTAFKDDPDSYSVFALENWDSDKKTGTKSEIFTKNTVSPNVTVTSVSDVKEGLIVSVNRTGGVDVPLISNLTGMSEDDVTSALIDGGFAFKNKDEQLETAETYLSGNVRAKLREAEALASVNDDYKVNVEALKKVVPKDIDYSEIYVNPGTTWIPDSVYSDFAAYMLEGRNGEYNKDVEIARVPETGVYTVQLNRYYLKANSANTQKWGTARRSFLELFDAMLNSKSVVVKDRLEDGTSVINKDATAAANEKVEAITKEFQEWLWRDESRRTQLASLYNEVFNSIVTPKYNGENLTVNGSNAAKPLREHQKNAVQRIIASGGNTLLAHRVGAGKTYEMAAAAMKLKELGLVNKPMFVVPKSLVAQWGTEFVDFFPAAKLLVAEASDFTPANRKVFMNRIANGTYDAVIVSYEQFEKLPVSGEYETGFYEDQINKITQAIERDRAQRGKNSLTVKDLVKKQKQLQTKLEKLRDKPKDEGNISFEELGVDSLFVDEAHNFKNLMYTTSMTNVAGLGNKDGSKRAFDLYMKVRYLQQLNGGKGIVFATATPVMNSMSEMYIMQEYLQPDLLEQLGLDTFDAWAKQFGEVVNGIEIKPSGQGYRVKQSFSRFKNLNELQLLFRNFADVLTEIPGLKIPKMKGGAVNVVVCKPGEYQQNYMKELEERADKVKSVDPSVDNMLKITSDGRKISYTQRMIDPSLPYEESCKIYRCSDNIIKRYKDSGDIKGTQLVFCDMATPKGKSSVTDNTDTDTDTMDTESVKLYDDIKARLVKGGIPAKEIAFIHEADTDAKKKKLFADVNDGKVRVLIGSTGKMGVGMNAQKRVVAIHHLDAPWRPGDVEQRNGRAFRQGNINEEVECFTYVTEGSFDARLWDILERKQNFINQIMNGENVGREAEDTGEVTLSAAEVKALASGNPLIKEQVELDSEIKKLESLYRAHNSAVSNAKYRLKEDTGAVSIAEQRLENTKADVKAMVDNHSEGNFLMTVGGKKYTDKKEAGAALMAAAEKKAVETEYTSVGSFCGFDMRVIKTPEGIRGTLMGKQGYPFSTYPAATTQMINQIVSKVEDLPKQIKASEIAIERLKSDIAEQEKIIASPFAKQAELDKKRARYNEIMDELNPKDEQSLDGIDEGSTAKEADSQYSLAHEDLQTDDEYVEELIRNVISPMGIKVVFDKEVSDDASGLYDIVALDNGNVYVSASRNVITGTTTEELRRDVTNFFNDLLDKQPSIDIITTNGETLTITKNETASKARDNYRTVDGKRELMTDTEYSIKARVTAHIDEISEASVQRGTKIDDKNHSFAKNGFTYRRAYFKDFDGKYYEIGLSIGHNGTTATVYNVGKIKESVAPSANILAVVGSQPLSATLKKSNIPAADKAASGSLPDGILPETIIPQKFNLSSASGKTIRPLAYYDPETRTIHVVGNPPSLTTLLGHELFHALSKEDQARLVYFFRTNSDTNSAEFKKWQQEITELYSKKYAESGREFTEADFWREYAAMSCESLFTDKQFIERLCGKSPSLGRRILNWIRDMWYRITGNSRYTTNRAVEAGKLSEQALRKAALIYSDALGVKLNLVERQIVKSSVPEAIASDMGFGDDVGGINYSLEADEDITDAKADGDGVTLEQFNEDFESAKVVPKSDSWLTKGKNALGEIVNKLTRADSLIPERGKDAEYYVPLRQQIIRIRDNFVRSQNSALTEIMGMMTYTDEKGKRKALSADEAGKFTKLVYLNDLIEEAKVQRDSGKEVKLPNGYSEEDVHKLHDELTASLTESERAHINEALEKRAAAWKRLTDDYIRYNRLCGFDVSNRIKREAYYRHQVIDFMTDPEGHTKRYGKVNGMHLNDGRSFLKRRTGSERGINTDFASVEFLSLQQMHYDTEVAKALSKVKEKYDMKPAFVKRAKAENEEAIQNLILREAREAMAADMRSKGQAVKDEDIDELEPLMTVKNGKMRYVSETYEQIMQYNKGMARSLSQLTQLAIDGELDGYANTAGHRLALEQLKRGMMNESTFDFMSEFVSENDNEAAIAARVFFKNSALKRQFVEDKLGDKFMTWEKIAKNEGYVIFQPREGRYSYNMQALDESAARKLAEEIAATVAKDEAAKLTTEEWNAIISTYARQIRVMGQPYEQWAVKPLITQVFNKNAMEAIAGQVNSNSAVNYYLKMLRHWKGWVTAGNILRAAKYHIRNFIGDIEAALTADPGVLKMVPQAFGEIRGVIFDRKEPSDTYREWLELGGDTNLIAIQEMTESERRKYLPMFAEDLSTPRKVITAVVKPFSTLAKFGEDVNRTRESLLRYASYLYYKEKLTKSGGKVTDYVASNRHIINGLDTIEEKAYQLSADALGNYADISEFGRQIRRGLIPFYSFTESNMRRYYRFFANPIISIAKGDNRAANVGNLAKRMATPAMGAILLALINRVLNEEADDKLPEDVRNRPHITFGEWGGNVYAFTRVGNMMELLEWVGLDDFEWTEEDWQAPIDKLWDSITPAVKVPFELFSGESRYSDFDKPSKIRDRWEYFFNAFGLSDIYKGLTGKPVKNGLWDTIQNMALYKYDTLESAYWDTIDNRNNWKGSEGVSREYEPHQMALYYVKQAIRYGESNKAKKYVKEYFALGGTGSGIVTSISSMNPYWGMTSEESKDKRKAWEESLDEIEYEKLQSAVYYYESFLEIPEAYKKKLRKADNATAEQLMNYYIDYVMASQKEAKRK